jgi:hypothetical protein
MEREDLEVLSPEQLGEALARLNEVPYPRAGIESGLFANEPRRKTTGRAVKIGPGKTEPVLDFSSDKSADARGVVVQLQLERVDGSDFTDAPAFANVLANLTWGTDGGQQSAQVSIGQGLTLTLAATFVRAWVSNPYTDQVLNVSASAAPGAYAPNIGARRLSILQGAMPILAGPFAPPLLVDGVMQVFSVPRYAGRFDYAAQSVTGGPVDASVRLLVTQLVNADDAIHVLRVDPVAPESFPFPESPGQYLNLWQLDKIPLNPLTDGLRVDVTNAGLRFSGQHKLTFDLGL